MKLEFLPGQARDARRVIEMAAYHSITVTPVEIDGAPTEAEQAVATLRQELDAATVTIDQLRAELADRPVIAGQVPEVPAAAEPAPAATETLQTSANAEPAPSPAAAVPEGAQNDGE